MATEEAPEPAEPKKPKKKGGPSLPILIGAGLLLVVLAFALGLALRLTMFNEPVDDTESATLLRFETVYTGPGDYSLLRVEVHFSSAEAASELKQDRRERTVQQFRRAIDLVFRTAGASAFARSENALVPTGRAEERMVSALEEQARNLSADLKKKKGRVIVAVNLYFPTD